MGEIKTWAEAEAVMEQLCVFLVQQKTATGDPIRVHTPRLINEYQAIRDLVRIQQLP